MRSNVNGEIDVVLWTVGIVFRFANLAAGGHHY